MKQIGLLKVVVLTGIAIAMLFPFLSEANATTQFIDSGIEFPGVYDSSVAWGDYNNDGYLDFAICGRISEKLEYISRIYKNNGNNTFTDIGAGLPAG